MRMPSWAAAFTLVLIALSGCTSPDEDPEPTPTTTSPDTTGAPTTTNPGPTNSSTTSSSPTPSETPQENRPPTLGVEADPVEGAPPLEVVFTIDGSDPDGDSLTWTLDADGDGTVDVEGDELPGEATFEYAAAGNYTAMAVLSDGTDTAVAEVNVTVAAAAPTGPAPFTWSCTVVVGTVGLSNPDMGIGGCELGILEAEAVFESQEVAEGCTVNVAGESVAAVSTTSAAEEGTTYPAGSEFSVSCDPTMAPNSASSATFRPTGNP